jgi:cobyrinic acid a,c-diamide synthase
VGVLRKKGYKTCVLKVGPDIRDIVPSLYLNKERMENFSSIKIDGLGWKDLRIVLSDVKLQNYDIILVEGVMSIFTGMLNEKIPFSSAEIAMAGNIPVLLVSACNKGGIETAAVDIVGHVKIMSKLGIKVKGAILNKVYDKKIADNAQNYIKTETDLELIEQIPKIKIDERGNTPEVEMKLDEFCLNAMETVNKYLDVDKIVEMADYPKFIGYTDYKTILNIFN